jgi:hypothetical protein
MKISVLMPILLRQKFHRNIERILDSQTRQPDEVIFVEEQFSVDKHGDRINPQCGAVYISPDTQQLTYTEKKVIGLRGVSGDLIVIMSSDDYYGPEYIERWERFMQSTESPIARFQGHWVYNICDRRYGYVEDVSGGHSVYMTDWAKANYDSNENTLNHIDMPRTNDLVGQFAIIRHTPAGDMRADGWRRTHKDVGNGHTCGTEATDKLDPEGDWLRGYIGNDAITDFYLDYGADAANCQPRPK